MKNWKWDNIYNVARWEFFKTLRSTTFMILTFVIPLFMVGAGVIGFFTQSTDEDHRPTDKTLDMTVAVLDQTENLYPLLKEHLSDKPLTIEPHTGSENELQAAVKEGEFDGYLKVDRDSLIEKGEISYKFGNTNNISTLALTEALEVPLTVFRLQEMGMSESKAVAASQPIEIRTQNIDGSEPEIGESIAEIVTPIAMAMILIFAVIFTGQVLMYGVIREKKNRIVEILLSSISSRELMLGKVLGFGTLGLLQVAIWFSVGLLVLNYFWNIGQYINLSQAIPYLLIFIFGYLLLASLFAAVGATMKEAEGGSQTQGLIIMVPMIPLFLSGPMLMAPDATWVRLLSFLPPFNPVTSLLRIGATDLPPWELGSIIAVLIFSSLLVIYLGARIFEGAILQYDRSVSFSDILNMFN